MENENTPFPLRPLTPFQELTALQRKVGYTEGEINVVALLGLFGEAGEVLEGCSLETDAPPNYTLGYHPAELKHNAVEMAKHVDTLKKLIRKREFPYKVLATRHMDITKFHHELCDALYYLNALAINCGLTLDDLARLSVEKVKRKSQTDISHGTVNKETLQ